jgi:ribosomal protein L33
MRDIVRMVSTGKTAKGMATGTSYTTTKNKKTTTGKLQFKRFDKRAYNKETGKTGMHVMFVEGKV